MSNICSKLLSKKQKNVKRCFLRNLLQKFAGKNIMSKIWLIYLRRNAVFIFIQNFGEKSNKLYFKVILRNKRSKSKLHLKNFWKLRVYVR